MYCTYYRKMKILVLHSPTKWGNYYYEIGGSKNNTSFPSENKALKAAKAAIDKHLEEEAAKA